MNFFHNKDRLITLFIFFIIIALRVPHITASPFEACEFWRQSDTEAIARNFVENRFNIFFPQLNYDGPLPNYSQLEFQITTFLIAILYKLFGYHYILARLVPAAFFMGSAYFVYLVAKRYYSREAAWMAVILYGIMPLNLFFSRAIMPEPAALFFFVGAFYFFSRWIDDEMFSHLLVSAVFTALAISQKVPAVFVGIPMIFMAAAKYKKSIFLNRKLWAFALIALLPDIIYFKWLGTVAEFKFVDGIATKHIFPEFFRAIFTKSAWDFFYVQIPKSFTWYAVALALAGFLKTDRRKEYPVVIWALAMVLELATIVAVIKFNYYMVFITPPMALLGGKFLAGICRSKKGAALAFALLLLFTVQSLSNVAPFYKQQQDVLVQAEVVRQLTRKDDLIVTGTLNPGVLNAGRRQGWRANIKYYDYIPQDPENEVKYYVERGAKLFVPLKDQIYGDDGSYRKYLEQNYEKIEPVKGYPVYKLQ